MPKKVIDYADIQHGDKVVFVRFSTGPGGIKSTGQAVMKGTAGWVVNTGGSYGSPYIVSEENFVSATRV
jgi:hypothetical protein